MDNQVDGKARQDNDCVQKVFQ